MKANSIKETRQEQPPLSFTYVAFIQKNNCLTNS